MQRVRVLYVTEDVPNRDPVHGDGSSMISYAVLLGLPAEHDVALVTFDRGIPVPAEVAARCTEVVLLPLRERGWPSRVPALWNLARDARSSRTAKQAVAVRSRASDVTLLHGPSTLGLLSSVAGPVVVQTVDPWSQALRSLAAAASGTQRAYWLFRTWTTALLERTVPRRARLLTVGEADARHWSHWLRRPVRAIPNGVSARARTPRDDRPPTLCFVGSLGYEPNVDAAQRLVADVLPLVSARVPGVRTILAGRAPAPEVEALSGTDVEVRADVPDMGEVFDDADVAVFPDRYGTGIRNAVQEALASGLPVVATSVAARELPPHPARTVAETDAELADAVVARLLDRDASVGGPSVAVRSWDDCVADYVEELQAAVRAGG